MTENGLAFFLVTAAIAATSVKLVLSLMKGEGER